jgi:hypothetical protein
LLTGTDATFSGTLYAENIESNTIKNLQSSFGDLLGKVNTLENTIATLSPTLSVVSETPTPTPSLIPSPTPTDLPFIASPSGTLAPYDSSPSAETIEATMTAELHLATDSSQSSSSSDLLERLTEFLDNTHSVADLTDQFIASSSALLGPQTESTTTVDLPSTLPDELNLQSLKVTGQSSLADTSVSGQFLLSGTILMENNHIASLDQNLALSSLDTISMFGSKLIVDSSGNLTTEGTLTAKAGIITSDISPINSDVSIHLAQSSGNQESFGKLLVKGENDKTVASVDALGNSEFIGNLKIGSESSESSALTKIPALQVSGSASISGSLTAKSLQFLSDENSGESGVNVLTAVDNFLQNGINAPAIRTTSSAGSASLPLGTTEIVVFNPNISDSTLIYISPAGSTQNRTLYVAGKESCKTNQPLPNGNPCIPYFKVGIDEAISSEVKFNWWIIN